MSTVNLVTTVVGAYPKPGYLKIPDFFAGSESGSEKKGLLGTSTEAYSAFIAQAGPELESQILEATQEVVAEQCACGVDVPTDGEVRRENYIHFLCRYIEGIDFENLTETSVRNGAFTTKLPTIRGPVTVREGLDCGAEWRKAQDCAPRQNGAVVPIKYTLPGPMTIIGSVHDAFYADDAKLAMDLAKVVNQHVLALVAAGCKHIQVDEPLFARKCDDACAWGVKTLDAVFANCPQDVQKTIHICCGYPGHLDHEGYLKADTESYFRLAPLLDASEVVDVVSLEDAHRPNDLKLLSLFKKTTVMLGTMNSASSSVEPVEQMRARLAEALRYIDPDRLQVAPDCGLGLFSGSKHRAALNQKLANMCAAAKGVPYAAKGA